MKKDLPEVLLNKYMSKHGLTVNSLALLAGLTQTAVRLISRNESGISAKVAMRLGKVFNTSPELWMAASMNLQLQKAGTDKQFVKELGKVKRL